MVRLVRDDARGIVNPSALLRRIDFTRHEPSADARRFIAWYWAITWELPPGERHTQEVLSHPVVNVSFMPGGAFVNGVQRRRQTNVLSNDGWVLGIRFRPAGFRPFLDRPLSTITDRVVPIGSILAADGTAVERTVAAGNGPDPDALQAVDDLFVSLMPSEHHPAEDVAAIVEAIEVDRSLTRVDQLAARTGRSDRQLQRLFADHVGVSPKWVIRRYRIYEVAERARHGDEVDWSALAAELGYSDQAHLTRDFRAAYGTPPHRYLERCREALDLDQAGARG